MFKNKKIIGVAAVVLALMTVASATFAWFTSQDTVTNHLESDQWSNGDVKLVEIFDPKDPFDPGVDVNKDVWAVNTGNVDALVRISFAEAFQKLVADANGDAVSNPGNAAWVSTFKDNGKDTIPKVRSIKDYTTTNGWYPLVAGTAPFDTITVTGYTNAATNGYTILYKELADASGNKSYMFVSFKTITSTGTIYDYSATTNPIAQAVDVSIEYDKTSKTLKVGDTSAAKYPYFIRDNVIEKKWAALTNFTDLAAFTLDTPTGTYFADPANLTGDLLGTSPFVSSIRAQTDNLISLIFASKLDDGVTNTVTTNLATATIGQWWYNTADGYFYYIGKVAPAGSTSQLLDAVLLSDKAGNAYSSLKFDLTVKMDGLQAVREAADSWTTATGFGARLAALGVFA